MDLVLGIFIGTALGVVLQYFVPGLLERYFDRRDPERKLKPKINVVTAIRDSCPRCPRCGGRGTIPDMMTASIRTDTLPPTIPCPDCQFEKPTEVNLDDACIKLTGSARHSISVDTLLEKLLVMEARAKKAESKAALCDVEQHVSRIKMGTVDNERLRAELTDARNQLSNVRRR